MTKAIAFMYVYNEADILSWSIKHILDQGVDLYLLDNWSQDNSYAIATEFASRYPDRMIVARWPLDAPSKWFSLRKMLEHEQDLALYMRGRGYDWCLHYDADEIRRSAVPGETLIDGLRRIGRSGYNAIGHELELFALRQEYNGDVSPEEWFTARLPNNGDTAPLRSWQLDPLIERPRPRWSLQSRP